LNVDKAGEEEKRRRNRNKRRAAWFDRAYADGNLEDGESIQLIVKDDILAGEDEMHLRGGSA